MKIVSFICSVSFLCFMAGCSESSSASGDPPAEGEANSTAATAGGTDAPGQETSTGSEEELMGRTVKLTPQNTSIEFVCAHTDPEKPDPRHGSFTEFSGSALIDETLMSVQVDIETASLTTEFEKLTNHLKSTDFFDVLQYPKARFESTKVVDKEDGTVEITGDLTLMDKSNSIAFPATINAKEDLELEAKFEIDRTQWGMDFSTDKVEKTVELTIKIGKK